MALNQIPYTNVHELNLDWIIKKLQDFETELHAIEDYNPRITELESAVVSIRTSLNRINSSLTALNQRCTKLEDDLDDAKAAIQRLYQDVAQDIAAIQREVDSIRVQYTTLVSYINIQDSKVLDASKAYTLKKVKELLDYFTEPELIFVVNPFTNEVQTIQQFINDLAGYLRYGALTAEEYDALVLTAEQYDDMHIKALEFDMFGKYAIAFLHRAFVTVDQLSDTLSEYATKDDLESKADKSALALYALLKDIKVVNPVTGIVGTMQSAIDSLADFHRNGITAQEFDDCELTASQFDNLLMTAFNYDFNSKILLAKAGIITIMTGLSAADYDSLWKDATGRVYVTNV